MLSSLSEYLRFFITFFITLGQQSQRFFDWRSLVNLHIFHLLQSGQELLSEVRTFIGFPFLLLQDLAHFLGGEEHDFLFQIRFAILFLGFFPHSFDVDEITKGVVCGQLWRLVFDDVADGYSLVRERVSKHEWLHLLNHEGFISRDNVTSCFGWHSHKAAIMINILDLVEYNFLSEGSFVHNAFVSVWDESWVKALEEMDIYFQFFGHWEVVWHFSLWEDASDLDVVTVFDI